MQRKQASPPTNIGWWWYFQPHHPLHLSLIGRVKLCQRYSGKIVYRVDKNVIKAFWMQRKQGLSRPYTTGRREKQDFWVIILTSFLSWQKYFETNGIMLTIGTSRRTSVGGPIPQWPKCWLYDNVNLAIDIPWLRIDKTILKLLTQKQTLLGSWPLP